VARRVKRRLSLLKSSPALSWELSPRHRFAAVIEKSTAAVGAQVLDGVEQVIGRLFGCLDIQACLHERVRTGA
jgi:hypothetical protein